MKTLIPNSILRNFRTSELAWDMFRNFALGSKKLLANPFSSRVFRACEPWKMGSSTLVSLRFGHLAARLKQRPVNSSLVDVGRRYYSVDRGQVHHFRPRSRARKVLIGALVGSGLAAIAYFGGLEKIPYSKRTHLVLMPRMVENLLGEFIIAKFKAEHKILPATHPKSVRARAIAKKVIDALERGLRDDKVWGGPNYASRATQYLEHVNWEVVVVDEPLMCAQCYLGGKIVLFAGYVGDFRSDAEIACTIGHEVAHAVARHIAEQFTKSIFELCLFDADMPYLLEKMLSRKLESEADYIGLLLMASAGYDPRLAVTEWEKMAALGGDDDSCWTKLASNYTSTHPSHEKRGELLAQAQEEAMKYYRKHLSNRI